jgi:hypothetical protein
MDKEKLLTPRLAEGSHEIENLGTVRFRALSRAEVLDLRKGFAEEDTATSECRLLAMALIDPELTEDEVRRWQQASAPDEMEPLVVAIGQLSGIYDTGVKDKMTTFPDGSGD